MPGERTNKLRQFRTTQCFRASQFFSGENALDQEGEQEPIAASTTIWTDPSDLRFVDGIPIVRFFADGKNPDCTYGISKAYFDENTEEVGKD